MLRSILVATLSLLAGSAAAQDAVVTDGDKYKILLENEAVRVLEYRDRPGEKTRQHRHPPFTLYALSAFKRRLTLPDGKSIMREFKPGDIMASDGQTHIGENIGQTDTHVIIHEFKPAVQAPVR